MHRRNFLFSLGALLLPIPVFAQLKIWHCEKEGRLSQVAIDLFSDRDGMRRVGKRYLALQPQEADPERLRLRVESQLRGVSLHPRKELRRSIAECIQHDFSEGHVVVVNGWVLSLLEARLCGLCAVS